MLRPVTLITGASAGIGTALAKVFAEKGHEVVLVARRALQLTAIADSFEAAGHKRPHILAVDLTRANVSTWIENELRAQNASSNPLLYRIAFKMATGSGKTVVMAMLIAWHALNKLADPQNAS